MTRHSGHVPFNPANDVFDHLYDTSALLSGLTLPALKTIRPAGCDDEVGIVLDAIIIQLAVLTRALETIITQPESLRF